MNIKVNEIPNSKTAVIEICVVDKKSNETKNQFDILVQLVLCNVKVLTLMNLHNNFNKSYYMTLRFHLWSLIYHSNKEKWLFCRYIIFIG